MKHESECATKNSANDSDMVCACFNVRLADIEMFMLRPGVTVEDLIEQTNIGTKCTACLLDLEVVLSDLRKPGIHDLPPGIGSGVLRQDKRGLLANERIDSAFFICEEGTKTVLQMSNYSPLFRDDNKAVAHRYRLWVLNDDGRICAQKKGQVDAEATVEVDFSDLPGCPPRGWFLLSLLPLGQGYYGSLRPQCILIGDEWAASYHVQFHSFASNEARRLGVVLRSSKGKTYSSAVIINGENSGGVVTVKLSAEDGYGDSYKFDLSPRGSKIIDVDSCFDDIPDNSMLLLNVESEPRTRKYLINKQPGGGWGVDHFPNFP